ncbi:mechanosensitive ion channel family protein [Deinococcus wulumuqiensis]|uniref:Mechanosensitive ion channel protein MscS n=1 Tax=Deinococcus wulumuqiensis TaxID=980427 RepID=A0AAV4KC41_9DEIO|nr:mechanosensitive ion channel family protein [Deinococcus wulumuqiensis]QII19547.1 mechanosensitive ion channel family protein [Deinococcus wulumuqiensis R12]GGI88357.1 mechanosensitive ion channel protein MscS [Deinococcus wulumuqiensis]GGP30352.1 mechanosensitive ion channel protein MscS [Deinococcus wulumuqiensis]
MFDALTIQLAKPQVWVGLALTLVVAYALYRLGRTLLRGLERYQHPRLTALLKGLLLLSVVVGWLASATHIVYLPDVPFLFDLGADIREGFRNSAGKVVVVLAMAMIAWNLVGTATGRIVVEDEFNRRSVRVQTLKGVTDSTLKVIIVVVSAIAMLQTLGVNATSLLAGVSILGVAVGFGAQSLVRDVFTGFFILLEDQYGVGDVIAVGTGQLSGTVERLNLRVTALRALDGTVHIIPNGQIQTVSVSSKDWSRVVATVDVTYNADVDEALRVLDAVSQELYRDPAWDDHFLDAPEIQGVTALAPDGVTLRALFKVLPKSQYALGREFNRRIKIAMDQAGIEIPSPQRSVTFASGPLEVKLARPGEGAQVPAPAPAPVTGQDRTRPPVPPSFSRDAEEDER